MWPVAMATAYNVFWAFFSYFRVKKAEKCLKKNVPEPHNLRKLAKFYCIITKIHPFTLHQYVKVVRVRSLSIIFGSGNTASFATLKKWTFRPMFVEPPHIGYGTQDFVIAIINRADLALFKFDKICLGDYYSKTECCQKITHFFKK